MSFKPIANDKNGIVGEFLFMALSVENMAKKIVANLQEKKLAAEKTVMLMEWATAVSGAVIDAIKSDAVVSSDNISVSSTGLAAPNGAVTGEATGILSDGKIE
jgi:hypothetical protein